MPWMQEVFTAPIAEPGFRKRLPPEARVPSISYRTLVNRGNMLDFLVTVFRGRFSRTVLEHAEDFEYDDYYDYEYQ
jgi:hypothetical protein